MHLSSYDDKVRLIDARLPSKPLLEANVGGGAWRVKWHPSPSRKRDLLVACMHDGFKVVRFSGVDGLDSNGTYEVVRRFDDHKSLGYGVDWSYSGEDSEGQTLIASASFYDHTLHLWRG
jgi:diphthine methyl ester acylhydrolase